MASPASALAIRSEIETAETVIIARTTNGQVAITINGNENNPKLYSNDFAGVISDLVASDMKTDGAAKVVIRRVSPQTMFDNYPRYDFFNISLRGDNDQQLGGREGLKNRADVALNLALKLSPA